MKLPVDIQESFSPDDFAQVEAWWESLSLPQQQDLSNAFEVNLEHFDPLPNIEEMNPEDELYPYFEYLINHEYRVVSFVADSELTSSYRIVSSYIAALGSDYRHGEHGTVH